MPTLELVGKVVLATFLVAIFVAGFTCFRQLSARTQAREAAEEVHAAIERLIATNDEQRVEVRIPPGYVLSFDENRISIDGILLPEFEYQLGASELTEGYYSLLIKFEEFENGWRIRIEG